MRHFLRYALVVLLLYLWVSIGNAQDDTPPVDTNTIETDVYATPQFDLNFRTGPGLNWEVIAVIPAGETIPVVGRTASTSWMQVVYDGQLGWISTAYTVWSGDIITVPVDGQFFDDFVRRIWIDAETVRNTPYYVDWVDPSAQVGTIPAGTAVEVVGRLGFRNDLMFNVLVRYDDGLYWVGAWNLNLSATAYRELLDNSYRFAYSRLAGEFSDDIATGRARNTSIEDIWTRLQSGQPVSCATIIPLVPQRTASALDLESYPEFRSVSIPLDTAIGHVNTAIALFEDACNRTEMFITQEDVTNALDEVDSARQNYNVAASLLTSLRRRDPLLGDIDTTTTPTTSTNTASTPP
ncbi:MAG: SH3 domain-containing protein [Chloroflexota bacterium]